jgi:PAS domain S-box-containing protein
MGHAFAELVDIAELQVLCTQFTELTGFVTAILDLDGDVLVTTPWLEVCSRFHRCSFGTAAKCQQSDTVLANQVVPGERYSLYQCGNGLMVASVPIVIEGKQVANLFSGQFLLESPDVAFFQRQAAEFGFDATAYLAAISSVPVVSLSRVRQVMDFLVQLAEMIGRMGLAAKRIEDAELIVKSSPAVLFRWAATEGWPVQFVSENVRQFGYDPQDILSGKISFAAMVHPGDLEKVTAEVTDYSCRGVDRFQQEYRILAKDGTVRWIDDHTVVERDVKGRITGYRGVVMDITERKETEAELLLSKFCIDNAGIGIYHTNEQQIFYANASACQKIGYSMDELRTMTIFDIDPVVTPEKMGEIGEQLAACGTATHQTVHRCKDGSIFPVEITTSQIYFHGKRYSISFVKDISERQQSEEALRESARRLQSIFRVAPIGIGVVRDRVLIEINHRLCTMVGFTREELVGASARMLYPDDDEFQRVGTEKYRQIELVGTGAVETCWQRKDGSLIDVYLASTPFDPADLAKGVTFTALDITERKRVEGQLRASLAEKEVLLKEVHHRVKNNLQIVSTLLELQAELICDERDRELFHYSQNRIHAMALLHQRLYQSKSLAFIDVRDYLEELVGYLLASSSADPALVQLTTAVQGVSLSMDQMIPCGLIVNELVANALKHAFPKGRPGHITVSCCHQGDAVLLTVADDGVGLPLAVDTVVAETLGLQLVTLLTKQLRGQVTMVGSSGGTTVSIAFPAGVPGVAVNQPAWEPAADCRTARDGGES